MRFASVIVMMLMAFSVSAQVSEHRLLNASDEPQNWLTYSGTYKSQRYSTLNQITPANAKNLEMKWAFQADSVQKMEVTPLVVDGVMYITQAPDDIVSLDAKTGTRVLDIPLCRARGRASMLRTRESRSRDSGKHALHGNG